MSTKKREVIWGGPASWARTSEPSAPGKPSSGPPGKADRVETRGCAEMPIMPDAALLAAGRMIKLTQQGELSPYVWVHPDDSGNSPIQKPFPLDGNNPFE